MKKSTLEKGKTTQREKGGLPDRAAACPKKDKEAARGVRLVKAGRKECHQDHLRIPSNKTALENRTRGFTNC